jgi:hypothetical protein
VERPGVATHLYLRKANDDLVSHCRCANADAFITAPSQDAVRSEDSAFLATA